MTTFRNLFGPEPRHPLADNYPAVPAPELRFIAGPCSVESPGMILESAMQLKELGATMIRGGCYRYGTYPSDNMGFDAMRLLWLKQAAFEADLPFVIEIMDEEGLIYASEPDWVQIGARHAQHYPLLRRIGRLHRKVLLKRGTNMKLDELMGSVEYLLKEGAVDVAVVERGIVTFEDHCRWSFSASAIAALRERTNLKVIADPSHGSGDRTLVPWLAASGVGAGAYGVVCEVHPNPPESMSDAEQAITCGTFGKIVNQCSMIRTIMEN